MIIQYGLTGIKSYAEERLQKSDLNEHQKDFLCCMISVCDSLIRIAERFSEKAKRMLQDESDKMHRIVLEKIANTAYRIPAFPAETFYEAMCAVWFTREMCNALDGLGFAVIGHLDRILNVYYERDIREGRLTREEAQEYMDCFVSMTDARWDLRADLPGGTNADIIIGGCDQEGKVVYNEVSRMIIESYRKYRFANPKLLV